MALYEGRQTAERENKVRRELERKREKFDERPRIRAKRKDMDLIFGWRKYNSASHKRRKAFINKQLKCLRKVGMKLQTKSLWIIDTDTIVHNY